MNLPALGGFS